MFPASRRPRRLPTVMRPIALTPMSTRSGASDRERRHDLLDGRRRRHGDRQVVVDEQRRGRDERRHAAEVRLRDGVRAAARRVGDAHLAIAEGDDASRQAMAIEIGTAKVSAASAAPAEQEGAQDLLGRVGGRGDGVRAEDGQGLASWTVARRAPRRWPAAGRARTRALWPARARRAWSATLAASLAVSVPSPVYRKYGAWGRSTRTRRSPGLRPWSGRRPPIIGRRARRSMSRSGRPTARIAAWTAAMS